MARRSNSADDGDSETQDSASGIGIDTLQRDLDLAEEEFRTAQSPRVQTVASGTSAASSSFGTPERGITFSKSLESSTASPARSWISDESAFSSTTSAPRGNRHNLRHQATSLTGTTRVDWYDEDLLHRAVADAGRWAYGTILVEVWLLSHDGCTLIRPHQGWWIDPVHHGQFHTPPRRKAKQLPDSGATDGTSRRRLFKKFQSTLSSKSFLRQQKKQEDDDEALRLEQIASCPICRLTDETRPDYLEPAPMVPGEGLPGVLWADDHNPHFVQQQQHSTSGGPRRSFRGSLRGSLRGSTKGGMGGGDGTTSNRPDRFLFPKMQQMYEQSTAAAAAGNHPAATQSEPSPLHTDVLPNRPSPLHQRGRSSPSPAYSAPIAVAGGGRSDNPTSGGQIEDILMSTPAAPLVHDDTANGRRHHHHAHHHPKVVWRNIKDLANDPDLPWNPRLQHLADMGLGWAAAVPIRHEGIKQGIVIYMARAGVDLAKLQHPTNEAYLVAAANLTAAALILRTPRHEAIRERQHEFSAAMRRIRVRILEAKAAGVPLDELVKKNEKIKKEELESMRPQHMEAPDPDDYTGFMAYQKDRCVHILRKGIRDLCDQVLMAIKKSTGAQVKPPPLFTWRQSFHTFFGVLVTLLILTHVNRALVDNRGSDATLVLGPFGALMTLIYGLTAAPASQPRNAMMGQAMSLSLAIILNRVPESFWSSETRSSITTALAIALMTKLGWTHPPAGAAALIFAGNDRLDWVSMGILLMGNVIAIVVGSFVNNLSPKRQYPTYWGTGGLVGEIRSRVQSVQKQ